MLEIAILIVLAGKIGKIVESKGRKKIGYQLMLIGLWIGGEVFGLILGGIIGTIVGEAENSAMLFAVIGGLGCAIIGAVIAFQIAKHLAPLAVEDDFYGDVEYAERLQARERFRDRGKGNPPPTDGYTENAERRRRTQDDRIQE